MYTEYMNAVVDIPPGDHVSRVDSDADLVAHARVVKALEELRAEMHELDLRVKEREQEVCAVYANAGRYLLFLYFIIYHTNVMSRSLPSRLGLRGLGLEAEGCPNILILSRSVLILLYLHAQLYKGPTICSSIISLPALPPSKFSIIKYFVPPPFQLAAEQLRTALLEEKNRDIESRLSEYQHSQPQPAPEAPALRLGVVAVVSVQISFECNYLQLSPSVSSLKLVFDDVRSSGNMWE